MALEVLLVEGDILETHGTDTLFHLENPVHEQKRITVRQDLLDVADFEPMGRLDQNVFQFSLSHMSFGDLRCKIRIEAMATAMSDDMPGNSTT
jgi:hypothetical protein